MIAVADVAQEVRLEPAVGEELGIDAGVVEAAHRADVETQGAGGEQERLARVGQQADNRTRVVFDLQGAGRYSVYSLYNPYRVVIDFERLPATDPETMLATQDAKTESAPEPAPSFESSESEQAASDAAASSPRATIIRFISCLPPSVVLTSLAHSRFPRRCPRPSR